MRHPRILLDLILVLLALVAFLVPIAQIAAEGHMNATERRLASRFQQVCNVEGNLCVIATGAPAHAPFGRLLPGH
jgi:hypothetical protein